VIAVNRIARRFEEYGRFSHWLAHDDAMLHCSGLDHSRGDRRASLHLSNGPGRALLHCFSYRCDVGQILSAVGLSIADLFDEPRTTAPTPITPPTPYALAVAIAGRQRWAQDGVLDQYVIADEVRRRLRKVDTVRRLITAAERDDFDDENLWHDLHAAAELETMAHRLEGVVDAAIEKGL
jgi:hypothetical protein